jgi:hypothetical protein
MPKQPSSSSSPRYPYLSEREVSRRYHGVRAFKEVSESAAQVQAAMILITSQQLAGRPLTPPVRMTGRAAVPEVRQRLAAQADEMATLAPPAVARTRRAMSAPAIEREFARFGARRTRRVGRGIRMTRSADPAATVCVLGQKLFEDQDPLTAAQLFRASLDHPQPIVQIAGALGYTEHVRRMPHVLALLAKYTTDADLTVAELARVTLARIRPRHAKLLSLIRYRRRGRARKPSHTSALIHGTWASSQLWWQPGGDFYEYLNGIRHDVYGAADRFKWSGAYSDAARDLAGRELATWITSKGHAGLDLFGHSHGGNVAMLATRRGARVGKLVLLSTPVHWAKYQPDFTQVAAVRSVRVKMDLVVLADGGGMSFPDARIREIVLPIWFQHGASHDPKVWQRHGVYAKL